MKRKTQKIPAVQRTAVKKRKTDVSWFVLMGFNKDNEDETGMLAFDNESKKPYKIVNDIKEALKFPSKNVNNVNGFGTPDQWLEFFNREPELENWKFHLMKVMNR